MAGRVDVAQDLEAARVALVGDLGDVAVEALAVGGPGGDAALDAGLGLVAVAALRARGRLRGRFVVLSARPSASRTDRGLVRIGIDRLEVYERVRPSTPLTADA